MKKIILFSLIALASCKENKSKETLRLEKQLDSLHNETMKAKKEYIKVLTNG